MDEINLDKLKNLNAFLGRITRKVRKIALDSTSEARGKILDVGCGNCLFFIEMAKKHQLDEKDLFGVDLNLDLLLEARKLAGDNKINLSNILCGDGVSLPFKPGTFRYTFCLNTFINLEISTIKKILAELERVTTPGGYIIIDIRNKANPLLKLKYFLNRLTNPIKINAYTLKDLLPYIEESKLKIIKTINVKVPPFLTVDKILIIKKE